MPPPPGPGDNPAGGLEIGVIVLALMMGILNFTTIVLFPTLAT